MLRGVNGNNYVAGINVLYKYYIQLANNIAAAASWKIHNCYTL